VRNAKLKGTYVTVRGTASDNNKVVRVEVSFDNGLTWHTASGTETWSFKWRLPSDGTYVIRSKATDDEGNTELTGDRVTVIVDNTPPTVEITTALNPIERIGSFVLEGEAVENDILRKVEITTDGGETWNLVEVEETTWTYEWNPADGEHTLQVRAWDDMGHVGYSEEVTLIVDTTPPDLYVTTPDRSEVSGETFLITGTAYDINGIDYVEVAIGEESYQRAEGTESWTYLWVLPDPGEYEIYIRAYDIAGNYTLQIITLIVVSPGEGITGFLGGFPIIIIAGVAIVVGLAVALLVIYFRGGGGPEITKEIGKE
jgi:hypothetical protein